MIMVQVGLALLSKKIKGDFLKNIGEM